MKSLATIFLLWLAVTWPAVGLSLGVVGGLCGIWAAVRVYVLILDIDKVLDLQTGKIKSNTEELKSRLLK